MLQLILTMSAGVKSKGNSAVRVLGCPWWRVR